MGKTINTSNEACAVACVLVSNPQGALRKEGDGWQQRVNDLIRALRDERNELLEAGKIVLAGLNARIVAAPADSVPVFNGIVDLHEAIARAEKNARPTHV